MRLMILLAATGILLGSPAKAEPCDAASLASLWELTAIEASEPGATAFYKANPYEYLRFGADGGFIYVAGGVRQTDVAQIESSLDRADAADNTRYDSRVFDGKTLIIFRDQKPFQGFQCSVDRSGAEATEMTWTALPGMAALKRVQRRLK